MTQDEDPSTTPAFGIIFVGPPGVFSTWNKTPHGLLMDREVAEHLGQMAALAGAVDYRIFEATRDLADATRGLFATVEDLREYEAMLIASEGVPPTV